ncbi:hypothetical protein JTE90_002959 [Oedothorax gibbosus]|uniref:Ig-like domain-containing protein n=1 Tax=Oedothorax gibbosus TaxID=931172 RepID=A0AAV6VI55_9ARAC|nr:hypothetical protein JTE90_002959 [Oedothorax gibbosus]
MIKLCILVVLYSFCTVTIAIEPPVLQKPLMIPSELRLGERADVICTLRRGDLPVTFRWFFNNRPIEDEKLGKVASYDVRSSVYLMESLKAENVGNYTCEVTNKAGQDMASGQLLVEGELKLL